MHDEDCTKITDAEGNVPKTRWITRVRRETHNGGPAHWIHENYQCPNCAQEVEMAENSCCQNVPKGQFCHSDSPTIETDPDVSL